MSLLFLVCVQGQAANWSKQKNDELKFEVGIIANAFSFEVQTPKEAGERKVLYSPNSGSKTSFGFGYRNIGASISTANPTKPEDDYKYGTSTSTDLQFRFYGKRTYEITYQSYSGYYVKNSGEVDSSYLGSTQNILRPDITTRNASFNFFWNFHEEDYSLIVGLGQNGMQKKSGWASFGIFSASETSIKGDTALVPAAASSVFGTLSSLEKIQSQLYSVGYGIGGIASLGGLFATGFVGAGLGYQNVKADYGSSGLQQVTGTGSFASLRGGLGYNGEKNVIGIQAIFDLPSVTLNDGKIVQNTTEGKLFYAYRFDDVNIPPFNWISSILD